MMKKIVCWALVTVIGLVFSAICFASAMLKYPWTYNGIDGVLGTLLGTEMLIPLVVSLVVMFIGLIFCFGSACKKEK